MKITSAEFLKSSFKEGDWPAGFKPEVAFMGRSNVGKSSLMNRLLGEERAVVAADHRVQRAAEPRESDRDGGDNVWIMNRDGSDPKQISKETFRLLNQRVRMIDHKHVTGFSHVDKVRGQVGKVRDQVRVHVGTVLGLDAPCVGDHAAPVRVVDRLLRQARVVHRAERGLQHRGGLPGSRRWTRCR